MENLIPLFVALTGAAVLLQAGVLVALYLAVRKTSVRLETVADEVKAKALPALDTAHSMLTELRPKLQVVADNMMETTNTVRSQVERVDATVNDALDRARLQVIRADEMLGRTLDRVEYTSDMVTKTVVSPVRQVSGIIRGVTAGVEFLLSNRARKNGDSRGTRRPVPQDEMFI
ncbi:MAG: hypothetical protein WBW38_07055 [Candidatus Sulfotelmatobacter sp.]